MIGGKCDVASSPVLSRLLSSPPKSSSSSSSTGRSSSVPIETLPLPSTNKSLSSNGSSSSTSSSSFLSSSTLLLVKSSSTSALTSSHSHSSLSLSPSVVVVDTVASVTMKQDGEAVRLPENLESIPRAEHFPTQRHRWNTNEEIAALLISFDKHNDWLSKEVKIRPKSGSMLLYSRKKVRYRRDGYCWKKRKDGKTTREDHMKLKVQGIECIYGCYVHSAILPTFHRRCYWLLQNPDIVLVHYLNVPYPDDNKLIMASSISLWADKKEWTKEELISQLKPMFFSEEEPDINNELEISTCGGRGYSQISKTAETVEAIVAQLMEKQRVARAAVSKTGIECGCGTGVGGEHAKHCTHHPLRRLTIAKLPQQQPHHHPNHHVAPPPQPPPQQPPPHHHNLHHSHPQPQQPHPHAHSHAHHNDSPNTITSSRQALVVHPTSSETDANQVSSTSGSATSRYSGGATTEGTRRPHPPFTPTPSSSPSPSNNINNNNSNKSNNSNENLSNNNDNNNNNSNSNNNNNNSLSTTSAPLILNLSNIQGGGGLLILNSGAAHAGGTGTTHAQHPLGAPFTLTSYFGQPHAITSTANGGRISHTQVLHSLHQQHHPHSAHNSHHHHHHMQIQHQSTQQQQQQPQQQQQQHHHTTVQTPVLVKREAKEDVVESLRLDVTNGNLTMDSGTFANLVSSLEASEAQTKAHREVLKDSFLGVKSELSEIPIVKEELFSDTLTLSPEDIQKTLSANLPHNPNKSPNSADDNPMDFIDSNMATAEDDVLANLDAFDMLSDFPDLDHYDTSPPDNLNSNNSNSSASSSTNVSGKSVTNQSQQTIRLDYRESSSNITDYSPEWAYPEGGVKVLVTGPWYSNTSPYTVLFDGVPTPTTLVQAGVLRCYCPAHEAGLVTLQVACDGFVISNSVIFEYKKPPVDANRVKEEESVQEQDEHLLKFTLLQRLETMETRVQSQSAESNAHNSPTSYDNDVMMHKSQNLQDRVVSHCQKISRRQWLSGTNTITPASMSSKGPHILKGQTILHLAARLGYTRLIVCLLRWREENPSPALDYEVDALRKDGHGRTPLSWACAQGHRDAALILYRWNPQVIKGQDNQGATPLKLATQNGHETLSDELCRLEEESEKQSSSSSVLRKSSSSSQMSSSLPYSSSSSSPSSSSPLSSSSTHSLSTPNGDASTATLSTDGFLRPSPRRCDLRKQRHISVDFPLDSGGNSSPALSWSEGGVGVRRGRIVKRPSVDSGINLVSVDSFKRASLDSGLDVLQKHARNSSSGRPPVEGSTARQTEHRISDELLHSPMSFDFLADGTAGPGTKEAESEDQIQISEGDLSAPDDSRVFTLAEQIIAAIPERIKGEEEDVTDLLNPCLTEPPSTDLNMEVILDEPPDSNPEFNFEFSDIMSYRYMEVSTPSSSLSPASSTCLPSPASFPLDSPSPPPTTADFSEFFHASSRDFSKDFSNLTLSDQEQRELYEAAKIIQKAYRLYKGRKRQQVERDKERQAAVLIQNYYRRYKQYAYFRQMSRAATLIQTQFRSYCESKRFKKSQEGSKYNLRSSREGTPVPNLKRSYSQRRQHQAARKIQQFMRQTKQKLQRERAQAAERETSPGSGPPPIAPPLGGGTAPSPARPLSLTPRGGPGGHSSERSHRVTDPLLSTTARPHHRPEKNEEASLGSL